MSSIIDKDASRTALDRMKLPDPPTRLGIAESLDLMNPAPRVINERKNHRTVYVVPGDWIEHRFPLRQGMLLTIPLPPDFKLSEAFRLGAWLATLAATEEK